MLTLVQTINAEGKNRLKGIIVFADVNSAVNRSLLRSSMRTKILDIPGMCPDGETKNKELNPKRIVSVDMSDQLYC